MRLYAFVYLIFVYNVIKVFFFLSVISCVPGWAGTYTAKDDFEHLIPLSTRATMYAVLGIEYWGLCMLSKYYSQLSISHALGNLYTSSWSPEV